MAVQGRVASVTPALARQLLESNGRNRRVRQAQVEQFAKAMTNGSWDLNGETIKIADDGTVLDGQHRLMAIVLADVTVDLVLVEGLPVETQDSMDTGVRRKLSDVLSIAGVPDAMAVSTALNAYFRYKQTGSFEPHRSPTVREALALYADHPTLDDSVRVSRRVTKEIRGPIGVFAACHHIFAGVDQKAADEFFDRLALGDGLEQGNPIFHLRRHVVRTRQDRMYAKRPQHIAALTFKAFNHWRRGESISLLTYKSSGKAPEQFPILDISMPRRRKARR